MWIRRRALVAAAVVVVIEAIVVLLVARAQDRDRGVEVRITTRGFLPPTTTVGRGEDVTFKNESSEMAWPASDDHPTHQLYPGFDSGRGVAPASSWSFTFRRTGTWPYHNHLFPERKGVVVVR